MSLRSPRLTAPLAGSDRAETVELQAGGSIEASMQPVPQPLPNPAQAMPMTASDQDSLVFDRWLRRELSRLYDPVLHEPVPEHLRRLLEAASRGEGAGH